MIMRERTFLYNPEITILIKFLQTPKACLTPVGRTLASCRGPVHNFIHNFLHSFYPLSSESSQQVHIIFPYPALRLA
jgi:hypothetical protein